MNFQQQLEEARRKAGYDPKKFDVIREQLEAEAKKTKLGQGAAFAAYKKQERQRQAQRQANIRRMQELQDATPPEVLRQQRLAAINRARANSGQPPKEYKKGGKVKKTGLALVHKGEVVIPAHRVATVDKALKKAGLKPLKK